MSVLDTIRRRFHPLHHLRKSQMFRAFCARFDRLKMMRVAGVAFPIAGYFLKNFNMVLGRSLHEAETLKWFERLAGENNARVFWDVGANVGLYGFTFISANDSRSTVLYEPDPDNLAALQKTVSVNALEARAEIRPCAVSAEVGTAAFKRDEITGATGALATSEDESVFVERHFNATPETLDVLVTTLDTEAASRPSPDIIKIDVEGYELDVLSGAREMLATSLPIILFETSRDSEKIKELLSDLGYQFRDADTGAFIETLARNTFALCSHHRWPT